MKTLKPLFLLMLVAALATSCVSRKACERKYPPSTKDSFSIIEKTIIKDTTITITLPGDTISFTIPCPNAPNAPAKAIPTKGRIKASVAYTNGTATLICHEDSLLQALTIAQYRITKLVASTHTKNVVVEKLTYTLFDKLKWWLLIATFVLGIYIDRKIL